MAKQPELLLSYYGDDFTGSTDALEFLSRAGVKTVLFIEPPSRAQLARYPDLQAVGVAGSSRSRQPADMQVELKTAFTALNQLGASHVHYKVCSTFDSSPLIGSIGRAADIGAEVFKAPFIPVLVAAPALGRYCAFGNLFARMGIGSQGNIFRLDRHPSMSRHPVTPMDEGDLQVHLSKQTKQPIGLMDLLSIELDQADAELKLNNLFNTGSRIVLFDAVYEHHLLKIGKLINRYAGTPKPLFSIGSSGIEMALGQYWQQQGITQNKNNWEPAGRAASMLVISGSCSPVTERQINFALSNGFAEIGIDTAALAANADTAGSITKYIRQAVAFLNNGTPVILHTSLGPDDQRVSDSYRVLKGQGLTETQIRNKTAQLYGHILGLIANGVAEEVSLQRLVIAGGDTSSFVARAMEIEAVEMIAPVSPGAPLCRAFAAGKIVDGMELNFKGGQVGAEDYFLIVLEGKTS